MTAVSTVAIRIGTSWTIASPSLPVALTIWRTVAQSVPRVIAGSTTSLTVRWLQRSARRPGHELSEAKVGLARPQQLVLDLGAVSVPHVLGYLGHSSVSTVGL